MWKLLGTIAALVAVGLVPAAAADPIHACQNYGVVFQATVIGDNSYDCVAQFCFGGPSGSGAVGTGVSTTAGKGEAGASASAGTDCEQTADPDEDPMPEPADMTQPEV